MRKTCPKCKSEFECKHNENCFCMNYRLSADKLRILKNEFDGCLCEDCLKDYAQTKITDKETKK
ncbi:MAG: cysteine-rich CWC family protein [Bacteroidales bacterium]|nr:cysteine-rich CWC family protein [Bacteroidales bacterium]